MDYLEIALRSLLAVAALLLLTRINGPKQVGQLSFYDYVVGITAGSIAATLCIDRGISIWYCLIGLSIVMLSSLLLSVLTSKSMFMRRVMTGSPVFLIDKGKLLYDGLKRVHFDVNDLLRELRSQGYFDIGEINYAVMETNGSLSVMPKAAERPAKVSEVGLKLPEDEAGANVIIDGKIMKGNLEALDKDKDWLLRELERQSASLKEIALGVLDSKGKLQCFMKQSSPTKHTIFE